MATDFPDAVDTFPRPVVGQSRSNNPSEVDLWDEVLDAVEAVEEYVLDNSTDAFIIPIGDEATALTVGTSRIVFRMPFAYVLTAVRASLSTASSSGTPTFDINVSGSSILSTKLTIDATEKTSTTAATAAVLSSTSIADDAEISIDIDVAGTGAKGAKVTFIGRRA